MRLPPLPDDDWEDRHRAALRGLLPRERRNAEGAGPAMSTLVRHPDLTEAFLSFGVYLLFRSTLPPRIRELVILRIAHRTDCSYEWVHHVAIAGTVGLTDADIEDVRSGHSDDPLHRLILTAVDELAAGATLSDPTWSALREHLDEAQVMDLVFTVGGYTTLALAFNTFGVEPDHGDRPQR